MALVNLCEQFTSSAAVNPNIHDFIMPSGNRASENNNYSGYPWYVFDRSSSTMWVDYFGNAFPWRIGYRSVTPLTVSAYAITIPNTTSHYATAWTFEGSNNATGISNGTWTVIDTQTAQTFAATERKQYTLSSPVTYNYFRISITASAGGNNYARINEIELLGETSSAPTVTTQAVTNNGVVPGTATGNGTVTADGGSAITERGICIGTSANPTVAGTKFTASGTTGAFTVDITGLIPGTTYNMRAYATNNAGTGYGANVTFTVPSKVFILCVPDITPPSQVTGLAATNGDTQSVLTWSAATDNVSAASALRYKVYKGGVYLATTAAGELTYTATGLTNGTPVTFTVSALDEANNEGAVSAGATATPASASTTTDIIAGSQDGHVYNTGSVRATVRDATSGATVSTTGTSFVAADFNNTTYFTRRAFIPFSMAGIGATRTACTIEFTTALTFSGVAIALFQGTQSDTLGVADFDNFGSTELAGRVTPNGQAVGNKVTFTLNAAGLAYLDSVGEGTAKFCIRAATDVDNGTPPTGASYNQSFASSEHATAAYRPKMTVTAS